MPAPTWLAKPDAPGFWWVNAEEFGLLIASVRQGIPGEGNFVVTTLPSYHILSCINGKWRSCGMDSNWPDVSGWKWQRLYEPLPLPTG